MALGHRMIKLDMSGESFNWEILKNTIKLNNNETHLKWKATVEESIICRRRPRKWNWRLKRIECHREKQFFFFTMNYFFYFYVVKTTEKHAVNQLEAKSVEHLNHNQAQLIFCFLSTKQISKE